MIETILANYRVVAMVGLSADPARASHHVASYLAENGFHIIPVNPREKRIMGKTCYPNLSVIPDKIEVVDIFRRSEDVMPVVEEAIRIGAKAIWMQEGVINEPAAEIARQAGMLVVMDRCMLREHLHLSQSKTWKSAPDIDR